MIKNVSLDPSTYNIYVTRIISFYFIRQAREIQTAINRYIYLLWNEISFNILSVYMYVYTFIYNHWGVINHWYIFQEVSNIAFQLDILPFTYFID